MNRKLFNEKQRLADYIQFIKENINNEFENEIRVSRRFFYEDIKHLDINWYRDLVQLFNGKCAYCETYVGEEGMIDHFRPINGVYENKKQNDFYYVWLAYEWTNLYLACNNCVVRKKNYFPIENQRSSIFGDIKVEKPLLIDPCTNSPQRHLFFTNDGIIHPKSIKGKVTIDILDLNHEGLVNERKSTYKELTYIIEQFNLPSYNSLNRLANLIYKKSNHLAVIKQFFAEWIKALKPSIRRVIFTSNEWRELLTFLYGSFQSQVHFMDKNRSYMVHKIIENDIDYIEHKYHRPFIEKIEVKNIRGISFEHKFNLNNKQAPWLMLLGENGTGKTTVLQTLALTLLNDWSKLGIDASSYVNKSEEGSIRVKLADVKELIQLNFYSDGDVERVNSDNGIPVIAYGAVRLIPKRNNKPKDLRNMNVRNLFATSSNSYFLQNPTSWMKEDNILKHVSRVILDVLPFSKKEKISMAIDNHKNFFLIRDDRRINLHELSSGYQSIIAITIDIMRAIYSNFIGGYEPEGVVLIDEIDAHLHPTWRMRIVDQLRTAFPRMQFIVTSHDPLCLRGVKNEEIAVMKKINDTAKVIQEVPDPKGLGIDEILTSSLFNMESTIDPEVDKLINKYHGMLNGEIKYGEEEELLAIESRLEQPDIRYFGYTVREKMMYQVIDRFIARKKLNREPQHILDSETESELLEIWKNIKEVDRNDQSR